MYELTNSMKIKILKYLNVTIYRMNASNATGYSFSIIKNNGKYDWVGGYVYKPGDFDGEDYLYDFTAKEFFIQEDKG